MSKNCRQISMQLENSEINFVSIKFNFNLMLIFFKNVIFEKLN